MSELTRKMGVQPGDRICLLDPTLETAIQIVGALPAGAMPYPYDVGTSYDVIFYWPRDPQNLPGQFASLQVQITPSGAIWAIIPKRKIAAAQGIELTWAAMQAAALSTDLVDNKRISFNGAEYGTRFVIRKDRRKSFLGTSD
jgi:hypothetical protein